VGLVKKKHFSGFISYTFVCENVFQLSLTDNQEISIMGPTNSDHYGAFSFSYGKKKHCNYGFGDLFVGPSMVFCKENENTKYTIGINLGSQFLFTPLDELGLGFDAFCNLNYYKIFYGIRLAVFFKAIK
jgi:hypothetical protein